MPALVALPVKIASGASLSGVIDLRGYRWCGVSSPTAWTAARLTAVNVPTRGARADQSTTPPTPVTPPVFATTLGGCVDETGALIVFAVDAALQVSGQQTMFVGSAKMAGECIAEVQLRSTNTASAAAVNQGADRYLWLLLEPRT